jgi:hypothetical protein
MKKDLVIPNIGTISEWKAIFLLCLKEADYFEVAYPLGEDDNDNPLIIGRDYFSSQPFIKSKSWELMDNSVLFYGELTSDIKNNIFKLVSPSFLGDKSDLWSFSLFKNNDKLLTISDFNVCTFHNLQEITKLLHKIGINIMDIVD